MFVCWRMRVAEVMENSLSKQEPAFYFTKGVDNRNFLFEVWSTVSLWKHNKDSGDFEIIETIF